jgi:hypothetical protein
VSMLLPSLPAGAWAWFLAARANYIRAATNEGELTDEEILMNVNLRDLAHMRRIRSATRGRVRGKKGII